MIYAYEQVLASPKLTDRTDSVCDLVAKTVLACAKGDCDRVTLYDDALWQLTGYLAHTGQRSEAG